MNLMFLHGAIYAGEASGMATPFQAFFRWLSFAVAIPVVLFSARPFFRTALAGLRVRIVHIDLPIAIAITVAFAASAWNTVRGSGPLWFDSLAMLVAALLGARQVQRSAQRAALERADSLRGAAFIELRGASAATAPTLPPSRFRSPRSSRATGSRSAPASSSPSTASSFSGAPRSTTPSSRESPRQLRCARAIP